MKQFFKQWRHYLTYSFFFSFFINLLSLTFPLYMLTIYDQVLASYSMSTLTVITIAAVLALAIGAALEFTRSRLLVRCGVDIENTLNRDVLENILKIQAVPGLRPEASMRDVSTLRTFFSGQSVATLFDVPWTPIFLGAIFYLHFWLGVFATGAGVILFVLAIINEKLTAKSLGAANQLNNHGMNFIGHATDNAEVVCGMGMLSGIASHWQISNTNVVKLQTQASRHAGLVQAISSGLRQSLQVGIYAVGAYLTLQGKTTAGVMIAASIIMGQALRPIQSSISTWKGVIEARGAYQRLDQLIQKLPKDEKMELPVPTGLLAAEQAGFALQNRALLQGINFTLPPGESMGLIGPSGAGKSTLCRLLLGIWPATAGKIRLDGADIFAWEQEVLGQHIGYLPQDVRLFSGTVSENIARFGEHDEDKVLAAAEMAGVDELVLGLPQGYDTPIGPETMALSGGQRQRVCLARALYNDPKLVILDEPNSNLDEVGEAALLKSFELLKEQGTTLVMVTHKPSLLAGVDKILLLRNGQMVTFGPRDEVFKLLAEAQQKAAQPPVSSPPRPGMQTVPVPVVNS
jgi:PrtD family type I secretion system ABC transporter